MSIAILGSCVTRDAFAHHAAELARPDWYFARSGLPSAMSASVFAGVDVSTIESAFQRAVVAADLDGSFSRFLANDDFDLLVYDAIDERFSLHVDPSGAIATRSSEFTKAAADVADCVTIKPHTDAYYDLWEPAWRDLVDTLRQRGLLERLRVNEVFWAARVEGDGEFPRAYPEALIRSANDFLSRLYVRMRDDLDASHFFTYPENELVAAAEHQWGIAPFHYLPAYYRRLCDYVITALTEEPAPEPAGGHPDVQGSRRRWWRRSTRS